jgi:SAM-dependent methyltransferase
MMLAHRLFLPRALARREVIVDDDGDCIVCGGGPPFANLYGRDGFTLVRCRGCGLVFQRPQPSAAVLSATYYHDDEWTRAMVGPWREVLARRAAEQLEQLERAGVHGDGARLLDVGCAGGFFMSVAERAGWITTGVELGEATAQTARERGLDVRTGTLGDAVSELEPGSFSLVTFWDVLEHVPDPRRELELARTLLAPGGAIAATMPNVDGLYPRVTYQLIARTTGRWEYPELPVHLYDFSPRTLARLLESRGFGEIEIHTFGTPFWYYRATRLSVGALGGAVRGALLRGAFELLRAGLYPLARLTDQGNSQFVLARVTDPPASVRTA